MVEYSIRTHSFNSLIISGSRKCQKKKNQSQKYRQENNKSKTISFSHLDPQIFLCFLLTIKVVRELPNFHPVSQLFRSSYLKYDYSGYIQTFICLTMNIFPILYCLSIINRDSVSLPHTHTQHSRVVSHFHLTFPRQLH